jgi:hypothetical protein
MAGPLALTNYLLQHPARWAGLGELLGLWPETTSKRVSDAREPGSRIGLPQLMRTRQRQSAYEKKARRRSDTPWFLIEL